jgi:hypothetical protein
MFVTRWPADRSRSSGCRGDPSLGMAGQERAANAVAAAGRAAAALTRSYHA